MDIPPYVKGEISCRACEKFDAHHKCWINVKNYGHDCKRFELKINIERYSPVENKEASCPDNSK